MPGHPDAVGPTSRAAFARASARGSSSSFGVAEREVLPFPPIITSPVSAVLRPRHTPDFALSDMASPDRGNPHRALRPETGPASLAGTYNEPVVSDSSKLKRMAHARGQANPASDSARQRGRGQRAAAARLCRVSSTCAVQDAQGTARRNAEPDGTCARGVHPACSGRSLEPGLPFPFVAAAAEAMRRILIDNARRKKSLKHGGALKQRELSDIDALRSFEQSRTLFGRWLDDSVGRSKGAPSIPRVDGIEFPGDYREASILVKGHTPAVDPRFRQMENPAAAAIQSTEEI